MPRAKRVVPQWEEENKSVIIEEQEVVVIKKEKMSKKLIVGLVVLVVILIAIGVWLGVMALGKKDGAAASAYSVVEMANGSVYFGKLSWWPSPRLSNAWILQRTVDERNQQQLGVVPADRAFWKPVSEIYLNRDLMVNWTYLREDSDMVKALEDPTAFQQQGAQQQQAPAPAPAPAEPKKGE